jgi:hypothetical protein
MIVNNFNIEFSEIGFGRKIADLLICRKRLSELAYSSV